MGQTGAEGISNFSIQFCSPTHTSKKIFLAPMYLQIKFHCPLKYSFRPLNKGAWHIDTSLDDAFLCKGLKGIQLYILEKIIDLH